MPQTSMYLTCTFSGSGKGSSVTSVRTMVPFPALGLFPVVAQLNIVSGSGSGIKWCLHLYHSSP